MEKENFFDIIFGESVHPEVIKKSFPLLDFLYTNNKLGVPEFEIMWHIATKKHETFKVAIIKALTHLATKTIPEHTELLFHKVKS